VDPATEPEAILEPELPIVDAHHHLWPRCNLSGSDTQYLIDELLTDMTSGHNVRATVFIEACSMYRLTGPQEMRSLGEVEFANGVAAIGASGAFGDLRPCAAIVGNADLALGDAVVDVLRAHIGAAGGRYRGVRNLIAYDPQLFDIGKPHLMGDPGFRQGFSRLQELDLHFEAWVLEPQLPELLELARSFPATRIVLNHVGAPVGSGPYAGQRDQRFPIWRKAMNALAGCDNVVVKLGGLATPLPGFKSWNAEPHVSSRELAAEWRPYVETCIELFGVGRCMFESDFPVALGSCAYPVLWNAFKHLTAGFSSDERTSLFSGTAARIYGLELSIDPRLETGTNSMRIPLSRSERKKATITRPSSS
jgi:L-fuconolactonase